MRYSLSQTGAIMLCLATFNCANAQTGEQVSTEKALKDISNFASDFCGEYIKEGSSKNLEASGSAKAELDGFLGRLIDLGIDGAAKFSADEYIGILREDLSKELIDARECRLRLWNDLKHLVPERSSESGGSDEDSSSKERKDLRQEKASALDQFSLDDEETTLLLDGGHSLTYRRTVNPKCVFSVLNGKNREHCVGMILEIQHEDQVCDLIYMGTKDEGESADYVLRCTGA